MHGRADRWGLRSWPRRRWISGLFLLTSMLLLRSVVAATPQPAHGGQATLLARFAATGLPTGPATGLAWRKEFPSGFTSRHLHGGPGYVYVLSGVVQVSDAAGRRTYRAGTFFWEPAGHVHTLTVVQTAVLFVLRFLPPGAADTVVR